MLKQVLSGRHPAQLDLSIRRQSCMRSPANRVSTRPRDSPVRTFDSRADRSTLSLHIGINVSKSCVEVAVWFPVLLLYPSHTCAVNSSVLEYRHRCLYQDMFHTKYALFRRSRRRSEMQRCKPPSHQRPQRWASSAPSATAPNTTTE